MEAMKRLIFLIIAATMLIAPAALLKDEAAETISVYADETQLQADQYAVAAQSDVWFYAAENEDTGLFVLPYTYYVKVLRRGSLYSAVQYLDDAAPYKAITGYCKTDALTFVDFVPERPYLRREITVSYRVDNAAGTLMGKGTFDKVEKSFIYYGTSYLGTARFFYVYADGVFDYVPAMQEVLYDLNTDYLQASSGEIGGDTDDGNAAEEPHTGLSGTQIVIICVAAAALIVIALFVLRGKKAPPAPQEFPEF